MQVSKLYIDAFENDPILSDTFTIAYLVYSIKLNTGYC